MDKLFDSTMDVMARSLDMYLVRHSVIADNIANAETPGYKARRVDFEKELSRAVDAQEQGFASRGIAAVEPIVFQDAESGIGQDLNTVDMDREMAEMTKNDLKYSAITQAVTKKFALLQYAISGGDR